MLSEDAYEKLTDENSCSVCMLGVTVTSFKMAVSRLLSATELPVDVT